MNEQNNVDLSHLSSCEEKVKYSRTVVPSHS